MRRVLSCLGPSGTAATSVCVPTSQLRWRRPGSLLHFPEAIDKGVSGCSGCKWPFITAPWRTSWGTAPTSGTAPPPQQTQRLPRGWETEHKTSGCHPPSSTHQVCSLFDLLTSGRRYGSLTTRTID